MAMHDDLREQLIKQFSAEVIELKDDEGKTFYGCPTCRRPVSKSKEKCTSCGQSLNWESISRREIELSGVKKAVVRFEVPGNFSKADCRKCPLSYIVKKDGENQYDCPLNMRNKCPLEFE